MRSFFAVDGFSFRTSRSQGRMRYLVSAVLALLVVGLGVVWYTSRSPDSPPSQPGASGRITLPLAIPPLTGSPAP